MAWLGDLEGDWLAVFVLELLTLNRIEVALGGEASVCHIDIWSPQLGTTTIGQLDSCIGVGQQFNCHRSLYYLIPADLIVPYTIRTRIVMLQQMTA